MLGGQIAVIASTPQQYDWKIPALIHRHRQRTGDTEQWAHEEILQSVTGACYRKRVLYKPSDT